MNFICGWPDYDPMWTRPCTVPRRLRIGDLPLSILTLPTPDPLVRLYVSWENYVVKEAELRMLGMDIDDDIRNELKYEICNILSAWNELASFPVCNFARHPLRHACRDEEWNNFTQHAYKIVFKATI